MKQVLGIFALLFGAGSAALAWQSLRLRLKGLRAMGRVDAIVRGEIDEMSWAARKVTFTTLEGLTVDFIARVGSLRLSVGDAVPLRYLAKSPRSACVDVWPAYLIPPSALALMALVCGWAASRVGA